MQASDADRAESFSIEGLFDRHEVSLDLFSGAHGEAEPRLRIIFDDNGTGKTTVLRCLYHLMSWRELDVHLMGLAGLPLSAATVTFAAGAEISFRRDPDDPASCRVEARAGKRKAALEYDAGRFDPRGRRRLVLGPGDAYHAYQELAADICLPPIYVADDRSVRCDDLFELHSNRAITVPRNVGMHDLREGHERPDPSAELTYLFAELAQDFRRATLGSRRTGAEAVYADVVNRIAEENKLRASGDVEAMRQRASSLRSHLELPAAYNLADVDQLDEVIRILNGLRRNHRNKKIIETVLDPFLTNLEAEVERLTPGAKRIDLFISSVNSFLSEKQVHFSQSDGLDVLPAGSDRSESLDPRQLSSGERHLLLLLGSATIAKNSRTIIIDEPELSLGIPWKRRLLSSLLRLTRESGARFLVASHSIEVITPYRSEVRNLRSVPSQ